jgi:GT2 family glycosyltransferase
MFVPRGVFEDGITFSTDFHYAAGEDIDFCLRARQCGHPIVAADHVAVVHDYGYTNVEGADWATFKARFQRYGAGEWQLLQRHPWYHHALDSSIERMNMTKPMLSMT